MSAPGLMQQLSTAQQRQYQALQEQAYSHIIAPLAYDYSPYGLTDSAAIFKPSSKKLSFRDELQAEVDAWLQDIKI